MITRVNALVVPLDSTNEMGFITRHETSVKPSEARSNRRLAHDLPTKPARGPKSIERARYTDGTEIDAHKIERDRRALALITITSPYLRPMCVHFNHSKRDFVKELEILGADIRCN